MQLLCFPELIKSSLYPLNPMEHEGKDWTYMVSWYILASSGVPWFPDVSTCSLASGGVATVWLWVWKPAW